MEVHSGGWHTFAPLHSECDNTMGSHSGHSVVPGKYSCSYPGPSSTTFSTSSLHPSVDLHGQRWFAYLLRLLDSSVDDGIGHSESYTPVGFPASRERGYPSTPVQRTDHDTAKAEQSSCLTNSEDFEM